MGGNSADCSSICPRRARVHSSARCCATRRVQASASAAGRSASMACAAATALSVSASASSPSPRTASMAGSAADSVPGSVRGAIAVGASSPVDSAWITVLVLMPRRCPMTAWVRPSARRRLISSRTAGRSLRGPREPRTVRARTAASPPARNAAQSRWNVASGTRPERATSDCVRSPIDSRDASSARRPAASSRAKRRTGRLTTNTTVIAPTPPTRTWLPTPMTSSDCRCAHGIGCE